MSMAFKNTAEVVAGKYRLEERLGVGGMAEVWSATNAFTDRQVAIKLLRPTMLTAETLARFFREARVSARVNHPNIVEVIDVGATHDDVPFMVMERLRGRSLDRAMRRPGGMTVHDYALAMRDVASALAAAHHAGVIHRDLKPTNIFLHDVAPSSAAIRDGLSDGLNERPLTKVLDFGISKFLDEERGALTMVGTVLGSPSYMSPEQARGEECDARTDIFSYGALWFEALTGMRPFEGANYNAIIVATATHEPKNIDALAPGAPASLRAMIRACLERHPKKRPPTFEHVLRLLDAAMPELDAWRGVVAFAGRTGMLTPTPSIHPHRGDSDMQMQSGVLTLQSGRRRRWVYASLAVGIGAVLTGGLIGRWAASNVTFPPREPTPNNLVFIKASGLTFAHATLRAAPRTERDHPTVSIDTLPLANTSEPARAR